MKSHRSSCESPTSARTGIASVVGTALIALSAGCSGGGDRGGGGGGGGSGGTTPMAMLAVADTFINSGNPENNDGAGSTLCVGVDDHGGVMRGLVRFDMSTVPAGATVSAVSLTLTMRATVNGTPGGAFAFLRLQAVNESWTEGNGVGDAQMMFPSGQTCSASVSGATWNQPSCTGTNGIDWVTPGGSVTTTPSGQLDSNTVDVDVPVRWSSSALSNGGLVTDVQRWIDDPSSNHGWRISAADEATTPAAQRFYSKEGDGTKGPRLTVTYTLP